jgi:hypothetical protein
MYYVTPGPCVGARSAGKGAVEPSDLIASHIFIDFGVLGLGQHVRPRDCRYCLRRDSTYYIGAGTLRQRCKSNPEFGAARLTKADPDDEAYEKLRHCIRRLQYTGVQRPVQLSL